MDSRRLLKIFATRWWLIGIVALAGVTTAYFVTSSQNSRIEETWEATAPVLILKTSAESDADYESRLRIAESRARLAVEVNLADNVGVYQVRANTGRGRLEFVAIDGDASEAETLAKSLRAVYLTAEPTDGIAEQLARNLNDLEVEIIGLGSSRAVLVAATPIDPGVATQLTLMQDQLSSLRQRAAALSLAIRFPELGTALDEEGLPRSGADVRLELSAVQGTIDRLQAEHDKLSAANPGAQDPDGSVSLEILVIDQQIRDLESQYIDTALTLEELSGGGSSAVVSNRTEVVNVTGIPNSPTRAGILGLIVGGALAVAVVIAIDRSRRPVFGNQDDLALPVIVTVDPSRPGAGPIVPWYPTANASRRGDVQALRSALEGEMTQGTLTIGVAGFGARDAVVQELAADLAMSTAASGREVLLIDAIFENPSILPEYGDTGATLADLVAPADSSEDPRQDMKIALDDRDRVAGELLSLRSGSLNTDAVDAVAGRRFRVLLDVAADLVEVVIVAVPQWGTPEASVLAQRLHCFILASRYGKTTAADLEVAAEELSTRRGGSAGIVLLRRSPRFAISNVGLAFPNARSPLPRRPRRPRRSGRSTRLRSLPSIEIDDPSAPNVAESDRVEVVESYDSTHASRDGEEPSLDD